MASFWAICGDRQKSAGGAEEEAKEVEVDVDAGVVGQVLHATDQRVIANIFRYVLHLWSRFIFVKRFPHFALKDKYDKMFITGHPV